MFQRLLFPSRENMRMWMVLAAVTALQQTRRAHADVARDAQEEKIACYFYGCPLLPVDVFYNEEAKGAFTALKANRDSVTRVGEQPSGEQQDALKRLAVAGRRDTATLTLIGYKGGDPQSQINQDRAFAVSPFHISKTEEEKASLEDISGENRLIGVFDGHAPRGELVSEFAKMRLPELLSSRLRKTLLDAKPALPEEQKEGAVTEILREIFVELDKVAPAHPTGGCTASVVLQMGQKVYIANAGDSRSFLATYVNGSVEIVYITREDKPSLPEERARVEAMGGQVYVPLQPGATSRVIYTDRSTGRQSGLAMSRSIGDWDAGKVGVVPDPIVDVVSLSDLVAARQDSCVAIDEMGETESCTPVNAGDIQFFAVSATDGLLDYVDPLVIAKKIAPSLFEDDAHQHPLSACEELIMSAAGGWHQAKKGRYRDDIAISVSVIPVPK